MSTKFVNGCLLSACLLSSGCSSIELPSVLCWSKTEVGIGARSVGEVEQILWHAQEELRQLDVTTIWVEVAEDFGGSDLLCTLTVSEQLADSLFLSTWWLEAGRALEDDKLICGRLSFAISESKPELGDDINIVSEGDIRVEAIFSGVYSPELEKEYVDELALRIVRSLVERMNTLLSERAEKSKAWATILSYSETH